jgi:hypothetical protein
LPPLSKLVHLERVISEIKLGSNEDDGCARRWIAKEVIERSIEVWSRMNRKGENATDRAEVDG